MVGFTDAVMAVVMTIMVLELKPPHGADFAALLSLWPTFLSFLLSFIYVGIYWNNHHHFFRLVPHVSGGGNVGQFPVIVLDFAHSVCNGMG